MAVNSLRRYKLCKKGFMFKQMNQFEIWIEGAGR